MIFNPIQLKNKIMAYECKVQSFHIVYGTRHMSRSDLSDLFPEYTFCFVKQEHGKKVVKSRSASPSQADAHWTGQKNEALVIQTADCVPLFLMKEPYVCAIHAGWRGVYQQITSEAFKTQPALKHIDLLASVGPHIFQENFEVDKDVALKLRSCSPSASESIKEQASGKYLVSLKGIIKNQLESEIGLKNWIDLTYDTFLSDIFFSFRRDALKRVGQYSFAVRIS